MARNKRTTLFNKNHISIIKIENNTPAPLTYNKTSFSTKKNQQGNWKCSYSTVKTERYITRYEISEWTNSTPLYQRQKKTKVKEKTVRLKSPLGFYYTKTIKLDNERKTDNSYQTTRVTYNFYTDNNIQYSLTYYTCANGARISFDKRPYELLDNEYFEDNYIDALISIINNLISETTSKYTHADFGDYYLSTKERGYCGHKSSDYKYIIGNMTETKKEIFKDLFGYPDGPKRQTNDEKILSHGFDLKTSFRKM